MLDNPLALIDEFLQAIDFAYVTIIHYEDSPPIYRLSFRKDGRAESAVAATLEDLLAAATNPGMKKCSRCGLVKPWAQFPRAPVRKDRPEGRHSHCKLCDRQRKRKYGRNRRRGVTDGEPVAPAP